MLIHCLDTLTKALYPITMEGKCLINAGNWKCCGYDRGTSRVCDHELRQVMLTATRAAGEDSIAVRTVAALCKNGSHSTSHTAVAVLVEMPDTRSTRSSPVHTGATFFHPAPAKYLLRTTHEGNDWVLPTEGKVAEINIFPLLSNIFFDIFQFFFQNINKMKKRIAQKQFLKFPPMCFH